MSIDFITEDIKFALDIGTRSVIGTIGVVKNGKLHIIKEYYVEHEERAMIDGQIHDINLVAKAVSKVKLELENALNINLNKVSIAAAGRFLKTLNEKADIDIDQEDVISKELIRSLELTAIRQAEQSLRGNDEEGLYCVGYSVVNYYLNGYTISNLLGHKGKNIGVDMITTFLPKSVVDSLYSVIEKCGLEISTLTLEPIAAIEAVVPQKLRLLNIAMVDIGAGTSDIAISSKESISAYGMVPLAGDEVTEVIAQHCLVDFNTAERIKKQIEKQESIDFTDILGMENSISSKEIKDHIRPVVRELGEVISKKIIELNGNKIPSAIFLVGGGAHTPGLLEEISNNINLPIQRIAIKDRTAINDCVSDNTLGSAGVTVIGIVLAGIKNEGNDFINVDVNYVPISLFNSHQNTVADALVKAAINPERLIGKRGKNLRYTLNGVKKISFGEKGINSIIRINGSISSLEAKINDGDSISINYAVNGEDGYLDIINLTRNLQSKSVYIDNKLVILEPMIIVNGQKVDSEYIIKDGDNIELIYIESIGQIKKYILKNNEEIFMDNINISDNYIIKGGEEFFTRITNDYSVEHKSILAEDSTDDLKEVAISLQEEISNSKEVSKEKVIKVKVNGEEIKIENTDEIMFVQIFNYIDFDLSEMKGSIILQLNGVKAGYTDIIKDGDNIDIYWDNN